MATDFRWRQQHGGFLQEAALNSGSSFSTSQSKEVNIYHYIACRQQRDSLPTRSKRKNISCYHCHHPAQKEALSDWGPAAVLLQHKALWRCGGTPSSESSCWATRCPLSLQAVHAEASSPAGLAGNQCLLSTFPQALQLCDRRLVEQPCTSPSSQQQLKSLP